MNTAKIAARVWLVALVWAGPSAFRATAGWFDAGANTPISPERDRAEGPGSTPGTSRFFAAPTGACTLSSALDSIPDEARALIILDARLHEFTAPVLQQYADAAARRRRLAISVVPVRELDDLPPEQVRAALVSWHAAKARLEGVLFVGNVKLPSFFLPRADIHSVRLWPRYFEDLDMTVSRRVVPGTVLKGDGGSSTNWPKIVGTKELVVRQHDFDDLAEGPNLGPELWAAFLPVGFQNTAKNNYRAWAEQLAPFFKKATAFHGGAMHYWRGLYLVSNDIGLLARSRPVWEAVGPLQIEFYSVNEKGAGAFKDNPAGYQRANLERYESLEAFLAYARTLPWMDEGWQSAEIFLRHMSQTRRRVVWWNVHSQPEESMISWRQAREMREGGLIALLNGCSVGGFCQPGSSVFVDTKVTPERNVLVNIVYGQSAFVAATGSVHDRVTDERATPLLRHLYSGGYLGKAHFLRLQQEDRDVQANPALLREFQEVLIGDPFADAQ